MPCLLVWLNELNIWIKTFKNYFQMVGKFYGFRKSNTGSKKHQNLISMKIGTENVENLVKMV